MPPDRTKWPKLPDEYFQWRRWHARSLGAVVVALLSPALVFLDLGGSDAPGPSGISVGLGIVCAVVLTWYALSCARRSQRFFNGFVRKTMHFRQGEGEVPRLMQSLPAKNK